ncbi:hypothetical protein MFFC18_48660 [Mariniblastus fucicola]|uniref:Chromosome partition protein Smc n=2 Tax=Mariniblastus fucicola TaxID=980251 RepID=A0A5B9PRQ9_9BACT|nr:hypothetical protein MFFC18_48660 [Mariniblastus fucicola]
MKTMAMSAALLGASLLVAGCEVNEGDVADARENVAEEKRETREARVEADREIAEQKREMDETRHKAMRPDYDELNEEKRELNELRNDKQEEISEEQRETREAEAEADRLERELKAKNARDGYVAGVKQKLESIDKRIDSMQEELEGLEGTAYQELQTNIELMEVKRDNVSDALSALENAEVMNWEAEKPKVEQALERINDSK